MPDESQEAGFESLARRRSGSVGREFLGFLRQNKKWWLLPILVTLLVVGGLLLLSTTAAAPFIYTLF